MHYGKTPSRLAFGAMALGLAACATAPAQQTATQVPSDATAPEVASQVQGPEPNPHPTHIVKLHGKLPRGFDIAFNVSYGTTSTAPECSASFNLGGFGSASPSSFVYVQQVRHVDGGYEADFVVDKYLPGKCGWKLKGSGAIVTTDEPGLEQQSYGVGAVLLGDFLGAPPGTPGCPGRPNPEGTGCQEARFWRMFNDNESAPALVRCRSENYSPFGSNIQKRGFSCGSPWVYKKGHVLRENTRKVTIDVYDLNHEPDPAPNPGQVIPPRKEQ
jgi:hypothetical protein